MTNETARVHRGSWWRGGVADCCKGAAGTKDTSNRHLKTAKALPHHPTLCARSGQQSDRMNPKHPEFFFVAGNPFGNVVSVSSPPGEPVAAHVSGGVLFVNWLSAMRGSSLIA
jgi:hypothetical protein